MIRTKNKILSETNNIKRMKAENNDKNNKYNTLKYQHKNTP